MRDAENMSAADLLRHDELRSIAPHDYTAMCAFALLLQERLGEARSKLQAKNRYIEQLQKLYMEATEQGSVPKCAQNGAGEGNRTLDQQLGKG